MRKLGIVIAITAAATLGFTGNAFADGHEGTLCPAIDGATQPIVDGGLPAPETQDGLVETCTSSNSTDGLVAGPLVCGVSADLRATPLAPLGDGVDQLREALEENGLNAAPINLTGCDDKVTQTGNTGSPVTGPGGGGAGPSVLGANAAADGSLPRTGGELFAGAGFALMSLGALVRRFLP